MPSPQNTRDQDPELAPVVRHLRELGRKVERADEVRRDARAARRQVAADAFRAGMSWRRIAEHGNYGTAQAAQQDVTNNSPLRRRSTD